MIATQAGATITEKSASLEPLPESALIAERYEIRALLGRGGMAFVYRVRDLVASREVALKQLVVPSSASKSVIAALFEREFHTLAQLRHPHVIAVYDYGLFDSSSYYTMELLDGGDLRERGLVPWPEACRLFFDVCSSIALLHSRRLLHRDISPRNIRCTPDGRAKLIDFGAMAPMNAGAAEVVGTPPFVAPETVHRLALDARTDLFSLGATLYYALTGRLAFPSRTFAEAMAAWRTKVAPPSTLTAGIPAALDDLVLALIDPEPVRRPQSAFEVMHRLAAVAGFQQEESAAVTASYLTTPTLVGRDTRLREVRAQLAAVRMSRSSAWLMHGATGVGRSRMLDALALEAKTLGFTVLRAAATPPAKPFAVAHALTRHLLEMLPSAALAKLAPTLLEPEDHRDNPRDGQPARLVLKQFADPALDPEPLQDAFCALWASVSRRWPLLIAVDDVHRIDASSAAVLTAFLDQTYEAPVFVALSCHSDATASNTVHALARRSRSVEITPLTAAETRALLGALFGEVANLDLLSHELHRVAAGNPRQAIDLAQYLVDRGVIRYVAGAWTLPAKLAASDLPHSFADAVRARATTLSSDARCLAQAHALAFNEALSAAQYRELSVQASSQRVEQAIGELLAVQALVGDGATYTLANRLWGVVLTDTLSPDELAERHRTLATMYRSTSPVAFIYHAFAGGLDEEALDALLKLNERYAATPDNRVEVIEQNVAKMMVCYPRALEAAHRLGYSAREINELRRWNLVGCVTTEFADHPESARDWLAQLKHDSGLDLYQADAGPDPGQRLMRALGAAQQRYLALAPDQRVYSVEEALRRLAEYVAICIMIGGRSHDLALLSSLPPLLEPFIALSPMLEAIWNNSVASYTMLGTGNLLLARERWLSVLQKIDNASTTEMTFAREIGNAVAYAIGQIEAQLGMPSATSWADRLERDPFQRIAALQLRRVERLQHGDSKAAERLRRQIEVLSLQARGPQMFKSLLLSELSACFNAEDLVGIKDALERLRPIAARHGGWLPHLRYAEGCFHLVCGDAAAACSKYQECVERSARGALLWYTGLGGVGEALLRLDRPSEARALLREALDLQAEQPVGACWSELERLLAIAEAKLGLPDAALRLEASIAEQQRVGASGVRLGLSYEARAQIALWQDDAATFARYAELTAREYRYGAGSALGAHYQRLINEARRRGLQPSAALGSLAPVSTAHTSLDVAQELKTLVLLTMARESSGPGRARAALELICAAHAADRGHLYVHTGAGLVRVASLGREPPLPELGRLQALIAIAGEHTTEADETATGELSTEAPGQIFQADGVTYELLLLSCVRANQTRLAGVAVIELGTSIVDRQRSAQLRYAIAAHVLEEPLDL